MIVGMEEEDESGRRVSDFGERRVVEQLGGQGLK